MSLPAEFTPSRHTFIPDDLNAGATCRRCGEAFDFGRLHTEPPVVEAVPDTSAWQHDDILLAASGVYRVRRSAYDGLRFVPLEAIADGQGRPPHGAKLIVRNGEVVR